MKTKILLIVLGFSISVMSDGKSLFHLSSFSAKARSENQGVHNVIKDRMKEKILILCQSKTGCSLATPPTPVLLTLPSIQESRIKEIQTGGKMSMTDPRKPIWLKDISKPKQGSKRNQIFRKIAESRQPLIKEENKTPTPVVAELKRNQTSVRLIKSCHFDNIEKCNNLEWLEFWNSRNSMPQPAGSNKTPMTQKESQNQENQAKTTDFTKNQMDKSNLQISSKTEKESINLHSKVPSKLTRDQIPRVKICYFDKYERCTREDWYRYIKGNQELSKGQLGSGQTSKTEKEPINLPSKSQSELTKERERKLQLIGSGSELAKDPKATVKICSFKNFGRCTRKEWYEFLKGNNGLIWQLSKSHLI